MAYKIQVNPIIDEQFIFRDGKRKLKIRMHAYVDDIILRYEKAQKELEAAEKLFKADASDLAAEAYGKAAVALIQAVFGEEAAAAMFKFYDGRMIQLLHDIYPAIQEKILPHLSDPFANVRKKRK